MTRFSFKEYKSLIEKAKKTGLRITAHSGETDDTNDIWECIEYLQPERIGHGIKAAYDKTLMKKLAKQGIMLEVCPLSNLMTKAVENDEELKYILSTFFAHKVKFSINTDWPEMIENAHLIEQYEYLRLRNILTDEQIQQTIKWGFEATFIQK